MFIASGSRDEKVSIWNLDEIDAGFLAQILFFISKLNKN